MDWKKPPFARTFGGGFSLTEALVALFILGLVAALTSSTLQNLAPKYRLMSAVREIHSRLNQARYTAILEGRTVRLTFKSHSYTIEKYDEDRKEWIPEKECFLDGTTIQANNSPMFHPQGTVSGLASIYVSNSWGTYRITLSISGRIKVSRLEP